MLLQNSNTGTRVLDNASQITDVVWDSINRLFTSIVASLPLLIAGAIVLILFWVLAKVVRRVFLSATKHTRLDERLRVLFSRLILVVVFVLGFFTALTVVVPSFAFGDFIAGLGLTSLAIGFATKDILNHLISGVLILWQQPFRTGDYLIMKSDEGKVEYIGVRATSLKRANGEVVLIPNGDIYASTLRIRKAGAAYPMSLNFHVGFESDLSKVKSITSDVLAASPKISDDPPPSVSVTDISSDGVKITANFTTNSYENRPGQAYDEVVVELVSSLNKAGIEVYPATSMVLQQPANSQFGDRRFLEEPDPGEDDSKAN